MFYIALVGAIFVYQYVAHEECPYACSQISTLYKGILEFQLSIFFKQKIALLVRAVVSATTLLSESRFNNVGEDARVHLIKIRKVLGERNFCNYACTSLNSYFFNFILVAK